MPLDYKTPLVALTSASENGPVTPAYPFYNKFGDADHVVFSQPMTQYFEDYAPVAINTTYTINGVSVYLLGDSPLQNIGAGVAQFDRNYANIPDPHFDYETGSFTYPGYFGGRPPTTQTSSVQIGYEYYIVGPGQTYETPGELPLVADTRLIYYSGLDVSILSGGEIFVGPATTPTDTDYAALVTADLTSPDSYSIVVDSKPEHYAGGIWAVVTRRTKAA